MEPLLSGSRVTIFTVAAAAACSSLRTQHLIAGARPSASEPPRRVAALTTEIEARYFYRPTHVKQRAPGMLAGARHNETVPVLISREPANGAAPSRAKRHAQPDIVVVVLLQQRPPERALST
jgi:hypothetical protein